MKSLKTVAGYNLLAILLYSIAIHFGAGDSGENGSMGILIMSAFVVGLHVVVCLLVAMVNLSAAASRELGRAWLLSAGIVLLVGFSVCLGNAAI